MAEVLGPVETLRAAAEKLRATATGTSGPPWYADGLEGVYAYGAEGEGCPTVFTDRRIRHQDLLWITLLNPSIAEPLADWLNAFAEQYEGDTEVDDTLECPGCTYDGNCGGHTDTVHEVCGQIVSACTCIKPALAVARVLVGVPDGR